MSFGEGDLHDKVHKLETALRMTWELCIDLHDNLWVYQPKCADSFNERMAALGLMGGEK